MAIQHKDITGNDVHEPKGIESASNGLVYVANGTGSGNWKKLATNGIEGFPAGTPLANQVLVTNGSGGLQLGGTPIYGISNSRNTNTAGVAGTTVPSGSNSIVVANGMTLAGNGLRVTQAGVYRATVIYTGASAQFLPNNLSMRIRKNGTTLIANSYTFPTVVTQVNDNGQPTQYGTGPAAHTFIDYVQLAATEFVEVVFTSSNVQSTLIDFRIQLNLELVR